MLIKNNFSLRVIIFITLIAALFLCSFNEGHSRRRYNPKVTKAKALEMLRENSPELARLAGLDPMTIENIEDEGDSVDIDFNAGELSESDTAMLCGTDVCEEEKEEFSEMELLEDEENFDSDNEIDIDEFKTLWLDYVDDDDPEFTDGGFNKKEIMDAIVEWLGTRYRFGGNGERGIDCSAFARSVFQTAGDGLLPRAARYQYKVGKEVNRKDLQFGDLIFFHTRRRVYVSHVGIYLGNDIFAHASSRYGVTFSFMKDGNYYDRRFIGAKRIHISDLRNIDDSDIDVRTLSQR